MIKPNLQPTLFPIQKKESLEKLKTNEIIVSQWFELGYISFDVYKFEELSNSQFLEISFVSKLIENVKDKSMFLFLIDKLPKPYAYDFSEIYYDIFENEWQYLPEEKTLMDYDSEEIIQCYLDEFIDTEREDAINDLIETLEAMKEEK